MTEREKEILSIIRKNPLVSQQELADALNITRSSIGVHITNLMKKGYIKGKGYIVNPSKYVTVIGGANIDIQGAPNDNLIMFDSNPGKIDISLGGVGRNISENLSKLDINTKFISAIGNDLYGEKILHECQTCGIDMTDCYVVDNYPTSIYLSILNESMDMQVALSHMDILEKINLDYIKTKFNSIKESLAICVDTNLSLEVLEYIVNTFKDIPIFLDTVSTKKSMKIKDILGNFHTIKANKYEAEQLSGIKINTAEDLNNCALYFLNQGVKNIFITLGDKGIYCANKNDYIHVPGSNVCVVNATGAGDAFTAALLYSYLNEYSLEYTANFCMASSIVALSHKNTINPNMSIKNIEKTLKEMILC